jgi:hypothetical protein
MRPVYLDALPHLEIAQQVREEPTLHAIDAHVELIGPRCRCDGVGPGLLLSCGVQGHGRDELARLEIEMLQLFDSEFKIETLCGFRKQKSARKPRSIQWSSQYPSPRMKCNLALPINYLFDGHGLGQVSWLIHVAAPAHRDVIRHQLQWNHLK